MLICSSWSVDIRAAAVALREQYGVRSVSIFGTCFGGGRALEAAFRVSEEVPLALTYEAVLRIHFMRLSSRKRISIR